MLVGFENTFASPATGVAPVRVWSKGIGRVEDNIFLVAIARDGGL